MKHSHSSKKSSRGELLAWLSFLVFVLAFLCFGLVLVYRTVPPLLGYDMSGPASRPSVMIILALAILSATVLIYLAATFWLLFARLFLSRQDVANVVFAGPTTRLDRWLFNALFPSSSSGGGA